jgi:Putative restriction endonuclease
MNQFPANSPLKPRLRKMTLARFQDWKPTDGWKYVWDNGFIFKDKKMVSLQQRHIVKNLLRTFGATSYYQDGNMLMAEVQMPISETKYRIPDLGYFTKEQDALEITTTLDFPAQVCGFVIEIISESDSGYQIENKVWEYFAAGVDCVWQIFPNLDMVKVYTAPDKVTICKGETEVNAAPVLPDFKMAAKAVFVK